MSRLSQLIAELCPDGVEYRKLGEIAPFVRERANTDEAQFDAYVGVDALLQNKQGRDLTKTDIPAGRHIYFRPGDTLVGNIRPYLKKIWYADCYGGTNGDVLVFRSSEPIESKFLYHVLASDAFFDYDSGHARGSKMPRGDKAFIRDYRIPIPPIEVQREIARILDAFQELDDALTAEIEARETELRAVQETLFDGLVDRMVPLGECVRFINGRAYKKDELLSAGKYRVLRVGNFFSNDSWYFSDLELDADKYCHEGDLLYAWSASFGPRIWHGDKTIFHYHIWKLSFDKTLLNRDYLLHFLDYDSRAIESSTSVTNSTMMHVSMAQMKKRLFPLPNIEVQEAVADKLNSISSLANTLRSERDARRKQFAYYRDKLLAFPELTRKADK